LAPKRAALAPAREQTFREKARGFMGVKIRQKIPGKGNPWLHVAQ